MKKLIVAIVIAVLVVSLGILFFADFIPFSEKKNEKFEILRAYYRERDIAEMERIAIDDYSGIVTYKPYEFYVWENENWTLVTDTNRTNKITVEFRNIADHPIETRWLIELPQRWAYYSKNDEAIREMDSNFDMGSMVYQPSEPTNYYTFQLSKTIPLCFESIKITALTGDTILHEETVSLTKR